MQSLGYVANRQARSLAVGLTGQMHGLVPRPAILWNDQRTQAQCDEIHRLVGRDRFVHITGNLARLVSPPPRSYG